MPAFRYGKAVTRNVSGDISALKEFPEFCITVRQTPLTAMLSPILASSKTFAHSISIPFSLIVWILPVSSAIPVNMRLLYHIAA